VVLLFVEVYDLDKFTEYLKSSCCDVEFENHVVDTDSSEYVLMVVRRRGNLQIDCLVLAHFVDHHYYAIMNLPPNHTDRELIQALIEAENGAKWRAPVEPVIVTCISEDDIVKVIQLYSDVLPGKEALEAVDNYLSSYGDSKLSLWVESLLYLVREMRAR